MEEGAPNWRNSFTLFTESHRQHKGEKIAILLPSNRQVFGLALGLAEAGSNVEARQEDWRTQSTFAPLDFAGDLPDSVVPERSAGPWLQLSMVEANSCASLIQSALSRH